MLTRTQAERPTTEPMVTASRRATRAAPPPETFATVTDLARDLNVTARAIRFYEDKGLITPKRIGTTRVYTNRERARMILILRGKRLGFSLREIKDYLDLYDADPRRVTQTRALLMKIGERRTQLLEQREAIEQALEGLDDLERDANAILNRAGARRDRTTRSLNANTPPSAQPIATAPGR